MILFSSAVDSWKFDSVIYDNVFEKKITGSFNFNTTLANNIWKYIITLILADHLWHLSNHLNHIVKLQTTFDIKTCDLIFISQWPKPYNSNTTTSLVINRAFSGWHSYEE